MASALAFQFPLSDGDDRRRPLCRHKSAGPADTSVGPDYGADERVLRGPDPSSPINRRNVHGIPTGLLCVGPLGKPLYSNPNPLPIVPQSLTLLLRVRINLPYPPTIQQPQRQIPAQIIDPDPRRLNLRR